jgi:DNA repair protein RecO (recombination protein O)
MFIQRKEKKGQIALMPFALIEITYEAFENRGINKLKEVSTIFTPKNIYHRPDKSAIVIFMAELVMKVVKEEEGNPELFEFLAESFRQLDSPEAEVGIFHLNFMLELSRYAGFYPFGNYENGTPIFDLREGAFSRQLPAHPFYLEGEISAKFGQLKNNFETKNTPIIVSDMQRSLLISALVDYFRLHLTGMEELKSHIILKEL